MAEENNRLKPLPKKLEEDMKRLPVPSRYKPEPFDVNKVLDSSVENALFDDVFGPVVKKKDRKVKPEEKSSEFTTLLASRLADAEEENKSLRKKLAGSNLKITRLEEKVEELEDIVRAQEDSSNVELLKRVHHDNSRLQRQLMEMEQFLADYGMHWVGYSSDDVDVKERERKNSEEGSKLSPSASSLDFDIFSKKIDELNSLIGDEPTQVIKQNRGDHITAKFARLRELVDTVKITMYKNGLMIKRGPFRPVGTDSYVSFVADIMDGYFPSEFRESCPDGVVFDLVDKRNVVFRDDNTTESSHRQDQLKASQLIQKLPKTVIKDGDIVNVRNGVESKLLPDEVKSDTVLSNKPVFSGKNVFHLQTCAKVAIERGDDIDNEIITSVQVKWYNGSDIFILKMFGWEIVGNIKIAIVKHFGSDKCSYDDFVLRCAYPPCDVKEHLTLSEAKLVPSGTLHARLA